MLKITSNNLIKYNVLSLKSAYTLVAKTDGKASSLFPSKRMGRIERRFSTSGLWCLSLTILNSLARTFACIESVLSCFVLYSGVPITST